MTEYADQHTGQRTTRLVVVSGGLRVPSTTAMLADEVTDAVRSQVTGPVEVTRVELREHAHAIADAMLTGFATGGLAEALDAVARADALVVVTPTFSASYSGLLKSFFDVLDQDAVRGTPVLLAATGGTERHSLMTEHALRPLFTYLGAEPVRTAVYAATQDFGNEHGAALGDRVARAATELARAAGAAEGTAGIPHRPARDGFADVVPFEQLLAR